MKTATSSSDQRERLEEIKAQLKREIDWASIDESLRLTPSQRFEKFLSFMAFVEGLRAAGRKLRQES